MTYYAVIDTNVLVSAMLKEDSVPGKIVNAAISGVITPLINFDIFMEYSEVMSRPKFHFAADRVNVLLGEFVACAIQVNAGPVTDFVGDPDDAIFYEVVMEARKTREARLVTGNTRHFPQETFVVTPKEMLDIIKKDRNEKVYGPTQWKK